MGAVIRREDALSAREFSFADVERQAREILAQAQRKGRELLAAAEARARDVIEARKQEAHRTGLAEGRRDGLEQALAEARDAALRDAQADLTRLAEALTAALADYERRKHHLLALAEADLIKLAIAIARRVCKLRVETSVASTQANVRALLDMIKHHEDLELRVSPAEYDLLRQILPELTRRAAESEHVAIQADPEVARGGCRLCTRDGTIEASVEEQLDRIAQALCADNPHEPAGPPLLPDAAEPPETPP